MNSLTKLSAFLFFALLAPSISQAQQQITFDLGGLTSGHQMKKKDKMPPRSNQDSIPVKTIGKEEQDVTVQMSNDSATSMLKKTRAQVFFVDHVRSTKKKVVKLLGSDISSIEVAYSDALISQYGDEAKEGVITILTKTSTKAPVVKK